MSQAKFARHMGVGKPAVSNWKKEGLLLFGECPTSGKLLVDVERSQARLNSRRDPYRGRPATGQADMPPQTIVPDDSQLPLPPAANIAKARDELLAEQLIGQRIKNAEAVADLVPKQEAVRRCADLARGCRERMHSMHRAIADQLAAATEMRAVVALLEAETDKVFSQLAKAAADGALVDDIEDEAENDEGGTDA